MLIQMKQIEMKVRFETANKILIADVCLINITVFPSCNTAKTPSSGNLVLLSFWRKMAFASYIYLYRRERATRLNHTAWSTYIFCVPARNEVELSLWLDRLNVLMQQNASVGCVNFMLSSSVSLDRRYAVLFEGKTYYKNSNNKILTKPNKRLGIRIIEF